MGDGLAVLLAGAFPARAGMNREHAEDAVIDHRVPRPRGDEPAMSDIAPERAERSPPVRG